MKIRNRCLYLGGDTVLHQDVSHVSKCGLGPHTQPLSWKGAWGQATHCTTVCRGSMTFKVQFVMTKYHTCIGNYY